MDKYQKLLVQKARIKEWLYFENNGVSDEESNKYWKRVVFDENNDTVTIIQDENPNIVDYTLIIFGESLIKTIEIYKNSKWEKIEKSTFKTRWAAFRLNINFDDRIEKVKVSFRDNLADDYIINVVYQEADKEKYYAQKEQERKEALIKNTQIKHSTGADLVNIYFQPCNEHCAKTEIELWIAKGKRENHHGMLAYVPRLIGGEPEQLMAKYIIEEGIYFKAINSLAKGVYGYKIKQYDKDNNIIIESEFNYFDIGFSSRPVGRVNR